MQLKKQGQLIQADFFENTQGVNLSDSPFAVSPDAATGGQNFELLTTGGFRKSKGALKVNTSADAQARTIGIAQHNTSTGTKTVLRMAGTALQQLALDGGVLTALTEDTAAASSSLFTSGSTQQVCSSQFNTASANVMWMVGGGYAGIAGAYSASKFTQNGVPTPTGSFTATQSATGGSWTSIGTYYYAVAYRKAGTQALSNAGLDVSATITATTDKVTINLTGLTNLDSTKYDRIYIYRSAVAGVSAFTAGDLVTQLSSSSTSYVDTGSSTTSSTTVPRAGSASLDNSVLPSGTPTTLVTWKRRLVTAIGSTVYISDLNKSESWPTSNTFTVPSGGPITALAIISFNTPTTSSIDELLVIFKERELWVVTGSSISDWSLKFIDSVGAPNQSVVVNASGYLAWINLRGIFLWDGSGKPMLASRPIKSFFDSQGDLDKSKINLAWGKLFSKKNQVVWVLSHKVWGEQKFSWKLDLNLTLPRMTSDLSGRQIDGVFYPGAHAMALYAGDTFVPSSDLEELLVTGDASGYVYRLSERDNDASSAINFYYDTAFLNMESPNTTKRFSKVIAWVDEVGTWKLYLDYWAGYRTADSQKSSKEQQITIGDQSGTALWDVAYWDVALWDDYTSGLKPIVFNLDGIGNNNEGDCIKLRFRQDEADAPITVHGFSVLFNEIGMRK